MKKQYETVIGLEVHIELATRTKIFCGCSTAFGSAPNTHVCPVCAGMPGSLPVLNRRVVEYAMAVGLATNCRISPLCRFDRKNYFYPDNPQNYQISQLYLPICRDGHIDIETETGTKSIGIHEIHMEEDAGKLTHDDWAGETNVDFNRSGVPLIEVVSEPDMRSADEVIAYLDKLRLIAQYLGASDCKLQEGSMRADVNLSVRPAGSDVLGTRTEMKNLNSFKAITRAVENERERQIEILEAGGRVVQETRRWDDNKERSYPMRSKEDAKDYRYFPEPDLPPVMISQEWIESVKKRQPELRDQKKKRYVSQYGLPAYDADILTSDKKLADLFEETLAYCSNPKKVSNWLMVETIRLAREHGIGIDQVDFSPANLGKLICLQDKGTINGTVAKEIFAVIFADDVDPQKYVEEHGLLAVTDEEAVRRAVVQAMEANPQSVADYLSGKKKAMGFLVGQTMRAMGGRADPALVNRLVSEALDEAAAK